MSWGKDPCSNNEISRKPQILWCFSYYFAISHTSSVLNGHVVQSVRALTCEALDTTAFGHFQKYKKSFKKSLLLSGAFVMMLELV